MSLEEEYIDWWVRIWDKLDELETLVKNIKEAINDLDEDINFLYETLREKGIIDTKRKSIFKGWHYVLDKKQGGL
jgi:predicted RNA binding protein with dsRBD fold (UPF0201 family)